MIEEEVTGAIIRWLVAEGWEILAYDLPQSGTGQLISLVGSQSCGAGRTMTSFIPDIIARKAAVYRFFENKDHFALSDFRKVAMLRACKHHSPGISRAAPGSTAIHFGVGLPDEPSIVSRCVAHIDKVDFIVFVRGVGSCRVVTPD